MADEFEWLRDDLRAMRDDMQSTRETLARIEARLEAHEKSSASHRGVVAKIESRVDVLEHQRSRAIGFFSAAALGGGSLGAAIMKLFGGEAP